MSKLLAYTFSVCLPFSQKDENTATTANNNSNNKIKDDV